jgi:UDP-glucose 6-dehydrogenase
VATKISFMNELANLAERLGADIERVRIGIGSDPRIGFQFIWPGCGYGGSCFPKDLQALVRTAQQATKEEATDGADALVICTEWKRFMAPNFDQLVSALRHKLIFDGRNLYDPERLAELGWTYYAIGRGASVQAVV